MNLSLKKKIVIWYTIWMSILAVLFIAVAFASSGYVSGNRARTIVVESVMNFMMKAGSSLMRTAFSFPFLTAGTTCFSDSFQRRRLPSPVLKER